MPKTTTKPERMARNFPHTYSPGRSEEEWRSSPTRASSSEITAMPEAIEAKKA